MPPRPKKDVLELIPGRAGSVTSFQLISEQKGQLFRVEIVGELDPNKKLVVEDRLIAAIRLLMYGVKGTLES